MERGRPGDMPFRGATDEGGAILMRRNQLVRGASCLAGLLALAACATSEKVQAKQIGDSQLSCEQLVAETRRLDQAKQEIDAKRGATGTNVAAALFWLPGLAYTYYDAGQAEQLILERKAWLAQLHDDKSCATPA
jgi:hypothetical protein